MRAWAPAGAGIEATSAGTRAVTGSPMDSRAADALRRLGGDPSDFRARPLTGEMATEADLVLTMTRAHRTAVLKQNPRGLRRTFTLEEAAALLDRADLAGLPSVGRERARELALRLDAARRLRATTGADDVADPIGSTAHVHRQVAGRIAEALRPLAAVLLDTRIDAVGARSAGITHGRTATPALR